MKTQTTTDDVVKHATKFGDEIEKQIYEQYESGMIEYDRFKELLIDIHRWELQTEKLIKVVGCNRSANNNQMRL